MSFTVRAAADPQRTVQLPPTQSTLHESVHVMSHTAPPLHRTLLEAPTETVHVESSSQ
jgi:hypothetical protein